MSCYLAECQTESCGTLRVNRTGVRDEMKKIQDEEVWHKETDIQFVRNANDLFITYHNERQVNMLTNVHGAAMFEKTMYCKDLANDDMRMVVKLVAILHYTQNMGGVDRLDRQIWVFMQVHRLLNGRAHHIDYVVCSERGALVWFLQWGTAHLLSRDKISSILYLFRSMRFVHYPWFVRYHTLVNY